MHVAWNNVEQASKVQSTVILLDDYSAIQIRYRWLAAALQYGTPSGPFFPTAAAGSGTSGWPFRMCRSGLWVVVLAFGLLLSLLALLLLLLLLLLFLLDKQEACSLGLLDLLDPTIIKMYIYTHISICIDLQYTVIASPQLPKQKAPADKRL
jgi:hypothetical protein